MRIKVRVRLRESKNKSWSENENENENENRNKIKKLSWRVKARPFGRMKVVLLPPLADFSLFAPLALPLFLSFFFCLFLFLLAVYPAFS